ncbi:MAG: SURF1 family cytochrome oxidase biogenesis protein [Candidatus Nanopelagicales bacterium]
MWTLLRTRRWLSFTALVVVAIVAFGFLSHWQWSRAEERRAQRLAVAAESGGPPVPVAQALEDPSDWEAVTATGTYAGNRTVLVRQRPLNGSNGFWVATPLRTADGLEVWVNRGWVAATGAATQSQDAPVAPAGLVTITGRLREAEVTPQPAPTDLPAGQVPALDPAALSASIIGFYVESVSSDPADPGVTPIPLPEIDEGRNISYAVQWILFAVVAVAGWLFFLRREAREDAGNKEPVKASG